MHVIIDMVWLQNSEDVGRAFKGSSETETGSANGELKRSFHSFIL